ncbi:hypothetical protein C8R43DRAFT_593081 [Mycena crocata]|nr:hypothetical protein C8R43DRAFT_593081 [Mycena crocata]
MTTRIPLVWVTSIASLTSARLSSRSENSFWPGTRRRWTSFATRFRARQWRPAVRSHRVCSTSRMCSISPRSSSSRPT